MPEPFLESLQAVGEVADTDSTITDQPRDEHDRQSRSETEDDRHQPVPRARKGERDINHRKEIDQAMRTESDGEEDAEYERPEPALLAVGLFEPSAYTMVMLMVMMPTKEQHDAADEHKPCEDRFAPMTENMLDALRLRTHQERDTEQDIRRQLTQNEHQSIGQNKTTVVDLFVDIADSRNTGH